MASDLSGEELSPIWWQIYSKLVLLKVLSIFPSSQLRSAFDSSMQTINLGDVMMITCSFKFLIEMKLSQLNNVELEIKSKTSKAQARPRRRQYVGMMRKSPHWVNRVGNVPFCSHLGERERWGNKKAKRVFGTVHQSFFEQCLLLAIVMAEVTQRLEYYRGFS